MPIEKWSDRVRVIHLADDPQFTDDMQLMEQQCSAGSSSSSPANDSSSSSSNGQCGDVVLDFASVHFVNSSNVARMLRLRSLMNSRDCKLVVCNVPTQVWGTFLVTGLDKLFNFSDNVTTALATLQMK